MINRFDYSKKDIVNALINVGIKSGDKVFIHSNIGFFGSLENVKGKKEYYKAFKESIFEVIGITGTLVVPTFTYSFCKGNYFDKKNSLSYMGFFSEAVRLDKESLRSDDANFSISAIGKDAKFFTENSSEYSFGENSFWGKFLKLNGRFCNFNFDSVSTFIHYVERKLGVPYRYDKPFEGFIIDCGKKIKKRFYHFCYDLNKLEHYPIYYKFDKKAKFKGFAKSANLGRGQIVLISAKDTFELIRKEIKKDPAFLIKGL